jgi:hypothetical protein
MMFLILLDKKIEFINKHHITKSINKINHQISKSTN